MVHIINSNCLKISHFPLSPESSLTNLKKYNPVTQKNFLTLYMLMIRREKLTLQRRVYFIKMSTNWYN